MGFTVANETYDVFISYSRADGRHAAEIDFAVSVGFTTAAALAHELIEARDEKRLLRLLRQNRISYYFAKI